jgi:hypothetical protein
MKGSGGALSMCFPIRLSPGATARHGNKRNDLKAELQRLRNENAALDAPAAAGPGAASSPCWSLVLIGTNRIDGRVTFAKDFLKVAV